MFLNRQTSSKKSFTWIKGLIKVSHLPSNNVKDHEVHQRGEGILPPAETRYYDFFQNAVQGIFQSTKEGYYLQVNPALARLYGYSSPAELKEQVRDIGKQIYVNSQRREEFLRLMEINNHVAEFESEIYRSDGSKIWISENVRVVRDRAGKILYFEGFVTDITERKLAEAALKESEAKFKQQAQQLAIALEELERTQSQLIQTDKMCSLGHLLAGVAHEINNPVNFVCGNFNHAREYAQDLINLLQLYQENYPDPVAEIKAQADAIDVEFLMEDFPKTLSSMQIGAERIRQIVQSIKNFSRLDDLEMKPVDIHEGIDNTLLILQTRLKAKGTKPAIAVYKEYTQLPQVECYVGLLNQVFMNLLSNAIDALDEVIEDRDLPSLRISTQLIDENWVAIHIADNGVGIPEAVKTQIFDPFYTTKPLGKGTGLGLSISYQIVVDKHRGQLDCISTPGQGTEFIVKIPVKKPELI